MKRLGAGDAPFRRSLVLLSTAPSIKHISNPSKISLRPSSSTTTTTTTTSTSTTSTFSSTSPEQDQTPETPTVLDSSSATVIGYNEDILLQIFPYLPPKSLLRFQAVSKQWLSIISSPAFRRLHLRINPTTTTSALFLFRTIESRAPELSFVSPREEYVNPMGNIISNMKNMFDNADVIGLHSCNGLLCIKFNFDYDRIEFVVYNPTTNQYRLMPRLEKIVDERLLQTSVVNIAFDPLNPAQYKLVCVLRDKFEGEYRFVVYSSRTGVWRETEKRLDMYGQQYFFERGVLWNSDLHWATEWGDTFCFDLDNECVRSIMPCLPAEFDDAPEIYYFGDSGGELYLISCSVSQKMVFNVFSLKMDYSMWEVKHRISIAPLRTLYPLFFDEELDPDEFEFHMLRYLVDEEGKNLKLLLSMHRKVIYYDINDMTVKELAEVEPEERYYQWIQPSKYSWRDASRYMWREAYQHFETLANI